MKNLTNGSGWHNTLKRPFNFFNYNNKYFRFLRRALVAGFLIDSTIHISHQMMIYDVRLFGIVIFLIFMILIIIEIFKPELFERFENHHFIFKCLRASNIIISIVFTVYDLIQYGHLKVDTIIILILEIIVEVVHKFLVG